MPIQNFKVTIHPDGLGATNIGITGYRREVKAIVEKWALESEYRDEILGEEQYSLNDYGRR